jgi:hypothetical protein
MPKKSKFLVVPYSVLYAGNSYDLGLKPLLNNENTVEIKPPIHMVVTRVTFQILSGIGSPATQAVLISDHIPTNTFDGYLLATINEGGAGASSIPGPSFTFENFGEESISQSFFLANVGPAADECYITVIFEGFINE